MKKNQNKCFKIVFLLKSKINSIEVLISKTLIEFYISHDDFVLVNRLKVYDDMKEEIKNLKTLTVHWRSNIFIKQFCIFWKCRKNRK